jgi:glutamyl-tRNA(Gln) amidotransferase subunit D
MYTDEIVRIFKESNVEVGDIVRLSYGNHVVEGIIMPRPESGDSNVIIIKRTDGYNMGVGYNKSIKIQKIGKRNAATHTVKKVIAKSNVDVHLLYTGGTIGSKIDYVTGGVYMLTKPEELLSEVPELSDVANIHVENLMSVASDDISYKEWIVIAKHAADALNSGAKGVVITMGTDTMHYTAAALSFMLDDLSGPVVITGAQRSSDRGSSDAFMNLICATNAAAKSDIGEVSICMHASMSDDYCNMLRGTKTRKLHTSRRDAFKPINEKPIAKVSLSGNMTYTNNYRKVDRNNKTKLLTGFEPKVAMLKAYPNSDPEILDYYIEKGYKGVIIEGTGLGHMAVSTAHKEYNWLNAIRKATDKGMIVGITSQCIYGRVNSKVYRNARLMHDAGAVYCEDMLPETAYVKLGFLLGNKSRDDSRLLLNKNMRGEITERTGEEEFGSFYA